jgi:sugar/nucleoside kinase (ribokinase family)
MAKQFQVCGIGNALVDIFVSVSDAELAAFGCEKATMRLVEAEEQNALLNALEGRAPKLASGGSVANSIIAFAQLGGKAAFTGCTGNDSYGAFYRNEFSSLGIDFKGGSVAVPTGTSVVLITPDAERTMRTALGAAARLEPTHVNEAQIAASEWLFIEGYLFANPDYGQKAIQTAVSYAKKHGTKIAVTCSEAFVVEFFGGPLNEALEHADLIFANGSEAQALSKTTSAEEAFSALKERFCSVVVTASDKGAYISHGGKSVHVPAVTCSPIDLTGAGDMYAGSFLYGITQALPVERVGHASSSLCSKVITQVGARLHDGTRSLWEAAI